MKRLIVLMFLAFTVGCASIPQSNVPFSSESIKQGATIGVVFTKIPDNTSVYPGADCLLCLAAAATANSKISKHVKSLDYDTFNTLKDDLKKGFESKGFKTVLIDKELNLKSLPKQKGNPDLDLAKRNFNSFKKNKGIDYLYVLDLARVGFHRPYGAYIPKGDPSAQVVGKAYLIDTSTSSYVWYKQIQVTKFSESRWKEPPNFPGLTNAFYQALESAKDMSLVVLED